MIDLCGSKGIKREYSNPRTPQQNGVVERKNKTLIEAARTMLADSKLPRIKREYSNPRTPQQNGVVERKNKTLIEAARTMLADSKLPSMFWTEVVRTACYVLNRVSVTSPHNKTPYALLTENIPSVSHFKSFGYHVTILNISDHLEESMNLRFLEEKPNVQGLGHEWYFDLDYLTDSLGYTHVQANQLAGTQGATTNSAGIQANDSDSDCDEQVIISADEIFQKELVRLKNQEHRVNSDAESFALGTAYNTEDLQTPPSAKPVPLGYIPVPTGKAPVPTGSLPVPTGSIPVPVAATMVPTNDIPVHTSSPTDSMFDGEPTTRFPCLSNLGNHNPSPGIFSSSSYDDEFDTALNNVSSSVEVNKYAIGTKWILKNKRDARGIVVRNKARLVAQGHRQEEGIDYDEVFALVARIEAIRLFLAFSSYMGFLVYQMDVKSAFLYGRIDEEVCVTQPKEDEPLTKTLFLKKNNRDIILVQVYLDDIIFGSTKKVWYNEFKALLKGEFQMSAMRELTFFLGLQVQQRPDGIFIHQDKSMIGSLMYLTASRPDIMFAVSACSRHQVTPTTSNLEAVKKILKYLKGQPKLGLWYPKESPLVLEAYSDSDCAGANKDRKSTTGGCNLDTKSVVRLWTKHIEIRHHFIRDAHEKKLIQVLKIHIDDNVADLLTKAFDGPSAGVPSSIARVPTGSVVFPSGRQLPAGYFWLMATLKTPELGPPSILATIDKTPYNITEELVRSRLQLADDGGIDDLPISKIYSGMDNLSYVTEGKLTFFKNKFSPQWRFLVHTLLHCLSTKSGSWDQFGSPITIALICLSDGRHFNWSYYILGEWVTKQYKVLVFSSKLFSNKRLNFAGHPMPLLPVMLLQAQAGDDAEVAEQAVPHPMPTPDQSLAHLPTPFRPQTSNPVSSVLEHDHSFDQHETATGSFPTREDAPLGEFLNQITTSYYQEQRKAIVNSPQPIYDQEPSMVDDDDETSKDKEIDKLMDLISLSFKKIYKPTTTTFKLHQTPVVQIRIILQGLTEMLGFNATTVKNLDMFLGNVKNLNGQRMQLITGKRCYYAQNVINESVDMNYDSEQIDQNGEDADLAEEQHSMVDDDDDDETSKDKEIDKLMALISLSFKKIYKPTNNNLQTSSNTSRANQDNSPRIHRNAGYESQRSGNVVGARETVDAVDSGPIFDKEPEQKVQNDDQYDAFAIEYQHPEQSESVHKTYLIEQDAHNV
nr:hypothetical protein [Tanacetum cinerariifolium]